MKKKGRRLIKHQSRIAEQMAPAKVVGETIAAHPAFRLIALANRPGYPFLGQDFFAECGDAFACHAVDNPDFGSELRLLRAYGPAFRNQHCGGLQLRLMNSARKRTQGSWVTRIARASSSMSFDTLKSIPENHLDRSWQMCSISKHSTQSCVIH